MLIPMTLHVRGHGSPKKSSQEVWKEKQRAERNAGTMWHLETPVNKTLQEELSSESNATYGSRSMRIRIDLSLAGGPRW